MELSGVEWVALVVGALMILGPMEAGAVHASQQGWSPVQQTAAPVTPPVTP